MNFEQKLHLLQLLNMVKISEERFGDWRVFMQGQVKKVSRSIALSFQGPYRQTKNRWGRGTF